MAKTFTTLTVANATAGNAILASDHASAFTTLNSHTVPPLVRAKRSADLSYTSSAAIAWDAEDYDTDSMHDTVTNNTRITFATAGIYRVTAGVYVTFSGTATAVDFSILGNGTTNIGQNYLNPVSYTTSWSGQVMALVDSSVYSYVIASVGMNAASSLVIKSDTRTWFCAEWVGLKA